MRILDERGKIHYAWVVLVACFLAFFVNVGLSTTSFSVYLPLLMKSGNYSNTQISIIGTIRNIMSLIGTTITVPLIKKFDVKRFGLFPMLSNAVGLFLFSFLNHLWIYYLGAVLLGLANGCGSMIFCSIILKRWFKKGFGTVSGICLTGSGVAGTLIPPIVTSLSETCGLVTTFRLESALSLSITIVVFLLLKSHPEDAGLNPIGYGENETSVRKKRFCAGYLTGKEVVILTIGVMLVGTGNTFLIFDSLIVNDIGFSAQETAYALSIYSFLLIPGKIIYGIMHDSLGGKATNGFFLGCLVVGLFLLDMWKCNFPLIIFVMGILGLGYCICSTGLTCWAADLVPEDDYEKTIGKFQTCYFTFGLLMSFVPGPIADATHTYRPVAFLITILTIIYVFIILRAYVVNEKKSSSL